MMGDPVCRECANRDVSTTMALVDERTFDAYRMRVTELERDMEAVQDNIRVLHRFCRVVVLCFAVLVVLYSACIVGLVMA